MNLLLLLSLVILAIFFLHTGVDLLNWRAARAGGVPAEFAALVDESKYRATLEYVGAQTKFQMLRRTAWLVATLGFLWLGGFVWVDALVGTLAMPELLRSLLFFLILGVLAEVFSLPFQIYETFVLEERFGFNRSTWKTFAGDALKSWILGIALGGPLLAALFWFFARDGAWLHAWIFYVSVVLLLSFVAPVLLLPLFHKFAPLADGELKNQIEQYARKVGVPLQGVFTMDGSKRSAKANAFFTGFGRFRRIVLFDTLIAQHTTPEIVAVLAHEIGHLKGGHVRKQIFFSLLSALLLFWLLSLVLASDSLATAFGFAAPSLHAGFLIAAWLYIPVSLVVGLVTSALSRKYEYEADAFAKRTTGSAEALVEGLKKLSVNHLSNLSPHPWKVWLEYSHPPVLARVQALKKGDPGADG